jgi:hypothetical protein
MPEHTSPSGPSKTTPSVREIVHPGLRADHFHTAVATITSGNIPEDIDDLATYLAKTTNVKQLGRQGMTELLLKIGITLTFLSLGEQ